MTKYQVSVLFNEGPGRFSEFRGGTDKLVLGPVIELEANSTDAALDLAWKIGNKMTDPEDYPRNVRSVSSGDVFHVQDTGDNGPDGFGPFFAVAWVDFLPVSPEAIAASLVMGRPFDRRLV